MLARLGIKISKFDVIELNEAFASQAIAVLRQLGVPEDAEHVNPHGGGIALSIYPWDIVTEMERRLENPQAMLLIVPNGKIKLLNALPFAPADLRRESLAEAWQAYRNAWRSTEVREFVASCRTDPRLLRHANETWPMNGT